MGQAKLKRYRIAVHEAGHAVVGLEHGRKLVRCSIGVESAFGEYGVSGGVTEWEEVVSDGTNDGALVEQLMMVALAGKVAEEQAFGSAGIFPRQDIALVYAYAQMSITGSSGEEIPKLTGFYCEHPDKVPAAAKQRGDEWIAELLPKVQEIVRRRWSDVELIADLLQKHQRVTPDMIPGGQKKRCPFFETNN